MLSYERNPIDLKDSLPMKGYRAHFSQSKGGEASAGYVYLRTIPFLVFEYWAKMPDGTKQGFSFFTLISFLSSLTDSWSSVVDLAFLCGLSEFASENSKKSSFVSSFLLSS